MELTREIVGQPIEKWVGQEAYEVVRLHALDSFWENRFMPHVYHMRQGEVFWTMKFVQ